MANSPGGSLLPAMSKKGSFVGKTEEDLGLPEGEVVTESYVCFLSISPLNKPIGKLHVTKNYIAFAGGRRRKIWSLRDVLEISEMGKSTLKITSLNAKSGTFGGFQNEESLVKLHKTLRRLLYGINGGNALHRAVLEANMENVKQICERDVKKLCDYNYNAQTPLILACIAKNDKDMVQYFLDVYKENPELDINQIEDKSGSHVLHEVSKSSDVSDDILIMLLNYPKIKVNSKQKIDNNTPLHYFCEKNHSLRCDQIGAIFIEKGADLNSQNAQHETPLHRGILNTSVRKFMVKVLLQNKASVDIKAGNLAESPLHYAVRVGSEDILKMLIEAGADITIKNKEDLDALTLARSIQDPSLSTVTFLSQIYHLHTMLKNANASELFVHFVTHGLYDPDVLFQINVNELERLGLDKLGPRTKFMWEIDAYKKDTAESRVKKETKEPAPRPGRTGPSEAEEMRKELGVDFEIDYTELEFLENLGKGASGEVFRGLYKKDNGKSIEKVAIKVLHTQSLGGEIQDFKKEFHIMSLVKHENIIKFHGVTYEPSLCMVMEYAENGSLFSVLKSPGFRLQWDRFQSFTLDMARGLDALHSHDPPVIHRDLKSLNLLVTSDWRVKVCDFGLSRAETTEQQMTFYKVCGTSAYCGPEIFQGEKLTAKSDVYSMGIVIWEMLHVIMKGTYAVPFSEFDDITIQIQIFGKAVSGVRPTVPPGSPIDMVDLYLDCVNGLPKLRPTSGEVVKRVLKIQEVYKENPSDWANTKVHKSPMRSLTTTITTTAMTTAMTTTTTTLLSTGMTTTFSSTLSEGDFSDSTLESHGSPRDGIIMTGSRDSVSVGYRFRENSNSGDNMKAGGSSDSLKNQEMIELVIVVLVRGVVILILILIILVIVIIIIVKELVHVVIVVINHVIEVILSV